MKFLLIATLIFHSPERGVDINPVAESFDSRPACLKWLKGHIADRKQSENMTFLRHLDPLFFCEERSKDSEMARQFNL